MDDRDVAATVHFIRQHACQGLSVVEASPLPRRTLNRRVAWGRSGKTG